MTESVNNTDQVKEAKEVNKTLSKVNASDPDYFWNIEDEHERIRIEKLKNASNSSKLTKINTHNERSVNNKLN
jgi:hypothetical protein